MSGACAIGLPHLASKISLPWPNSQQSLPKACRSKHCCSTVPTVEEFKGTPQWSMWPHSPILQKLRSVAACRHGTQPLGAQNSLLQMKCVTAATAQGHLPGPAAALCPAMSSRAWPIAGVSFRPLCESLVQIANACVTAHRRTHRLLRLRSRSRSSCSLRYSRRSRSRRAISRSYLQEATALPEESVQCTRLARLLVGQLAQTLLCR